MKILIAIAALLAPLSESAAPADETPRAGCAAQRLRNETTARIVFEEMLSRGRFAQNEHIYDQDFINHGAAGDIDRAQDRAAAEGWRTLAPDLDMRIRHLLSDCDHVVVHWLSTGTATGEGNGIIGNGQRISLSGMTLFRMSGGRIIEEWSVWDNASLLRQLGIGGSRP